MAQNPSPTAWTGSIVHREIFTFFTDADFFDQVWFLTSARPLLLILIGANIAKCVQKPSCEHIGFRLQSQLG
jgi:hypothetical protein